MSRTKTIDYRRMTFSFPAEVVDQLELKIDKGNMSNYVAGLVKSDLAVKKDLEESAEDFIESLRKLAIENKVHCKDKRSSLKILREIRYGGKY